MCFRNVVVMQFEQKQNISLTSHLILIFPSVNHMLNFLFLLICHYS